jgi:hypothetical protein
MEKNISIVAPNVATSNISKSTKNTIETIKSIANTAMKPVNWLSAYYSSVLGRKISTKQTLLLLNAQAAFVMTVFPVEAPFVIRLISLTWFVKALFACKKSF